MRSSKQIFAACIAIWMLSGVTMNAQPYRFYNDHGVTTDYNTCLVGVKDTSGNWIISPNYERIYRDGYGNFMVYSGGRCGVIDTGENYIIPLVYDIIYPVHSGWSYSAWRGHYTVKVGDNWGVIDSTNKVVIPIRYQELHSNYDSIIVAGDFRKHWEVYHFSGKRYMLPWKSKSEPDHGLDHTLIMARKPLFRKTKYGIVSDTGLIIAERIYDDVDEWPSTQTFTVTRKDKLGLLAPDGKELWPMIFDNRHYTFTYYGGYARIGSTEIAPMRIDERYGLISMHGDTILPFAYDYIVGLSSDNGNTLWNVRSVGREGIFDHEKGWIVPMDTTPIDPISTWMALPDSINVCFIVTRRDNMWGAILTTGQIIVPFKYEHMYEVWHGEYVFQSGDSLLQMSTVRAYPKEHFVAREILKDRKAYPDWEGERYSDYMSGREFSVFEGKNGLKSYYDTARTHDEVSFDDTTFTLASGNYYNTPLPDSILMATEIFVRPLSGLIASGADSRLYGLYEIYQNDTAHLYPQVALIRRDSSWKMTDISEHFPFTTSRDLYVTGMGDVIREDGEIIMSGDSLGYLQSFHRRSDGTFYLYTWGVWSVSYYDTTGNCVLKSKKRVLDFSDHYYWQHTPQKGSVQLVDKNTGAILPTPNSEFETDHPIWDSITVLEDMLTGLRLYNIPQNKYLMNYGVNQVTPLDIRASCFMMVTCNGSVGIINATGEILVDTLYDVVCPVEFDTSIRQGAQDDYSDYSQYKSFYTHWVLSNGKSWIVFDVSSGLTMSPANGLNYLVSNSFATVSVSDLHSTMRDTLFDLDVETRDAICYMRLQDSTQMQLWQKQSLIDTLFAPASGGSSYSSIISHYSCNYCRAKKVFNVRTEAIRNGGYDQYVVHYLSDSLLVFSELSQYTSSDTVRNVYDSFSMIMLFPDGPHQMTFDSLFDPATDWRNFIINTVLNYVNTHKNIRGDCHNPAMIPNSLRYCFQVTPEGLILYPPGFAEDNHSLKMFLAWDVIDPYLRTDIKSRLPINEKK